MSNLNPIKLQDAFNFFGLTPGVSHEEIKARYKELSQKYHPDKNPGIGDHLMKTLNASRDVLKDYDPSREFKSFKAEADLMEKYRSALNVLKDMQGIEIELCGAWLWISGNTKAYKDQIKASKLFMWSANKGMWYFRPKEYKSFNREKRDMGYIRSTYGSTKVKLNENQASLT